MMNSAVNYTVLFCDLLRIRKSELPKKPGGIILDKGWVVSTGAAKTGEANN